MKTKRPSRAKTIVADTSGSTCFSDLRFKNGTAYGTFARDGYEETWDMTRAEFNEWKNSDLGRWYNENLR
jgi:hypothetical protein